MKAVGHLRGRFGVDPVLRVLDVAPSTFYGGIVGWRCSDRCDTDLILGALEYAVWSRGIRDGRVVHHSDRGSNYTSLRFGQRLDDHGILASRGSVGDSYDNALMENFFCPEGRARLSEVVADTGRGRGRRPTPELRYRAANHRACARWSFIDR